MSYVVRIYFQRKQMRDLHTWLDAFAPGWVYYNDISKEPHPVERSNSNRSANEQFCDRCIAQGTADAQAGLTVLVPLPRAAMAAKIAWKDCTVWPLNPADDHSKTPIGDRM